MIFIAIIVMMAKEIVFDLFFIMMSQYGIIWLPHRVTKIALPLGRKGFLGF